METLKRNKFNKNRKRYDFTRSVWYGDIEDEPETSQFLKKSSSLDNLLFDQDGFKRKITKDDIGGPFGLRRFVANFESYIQEKNDATINGIIDTSNLNDNKVKLSESPLVSSTKADQAETKSLENNLKLYPNSIFSTSNLFPSGSNNGRKKIFKNMISLPFAPRKMVGSEFNAINNDILDTDQSPYTSHYPILQKATSLSNVSGAGYNHKKKLLKHMIVGPFCPRKINDDFSQVTFNEVEETVVYIENTTQNTFEKNVYCDKDECDNLQQFEDLEVDRRSKTFITDTEKVLINFKNLRRSHSFSDIRYQKLPILNNMLSTSIIGETEEECKNIFFLGESDSTDFTTKADVENQVVVFERLNPLRKSFSLSNLNSGGSEYKKIPFVPRNFDSPDRGALRFDDEDIEKLHFVEDYCSEVSSGNSSGDADRECPQPSTLEKLFGIKGTLKRRKSSHKHDINEDTVEENVECVSPVLLRRNQLSKSLEVLKSLQNNNEHIPTTFHPQKFPLTEQDDEKIEIRENSTRAYRRYSKSTNFDFGRRAHCTYQDFDVKGCSKIQLPNKETPSKLKKSEFIKYQNGDIYKYDINHQKLELLRPQVKIKSAKLVNRKEVELKDANSLTYLLFFDSSKEAKIFIENEKISTFIENDSKLNIAQKLKRLLRRRESRDILEKKGIYQNEPIFGNTLKNIFALENDIPQFIKHTIKLIEKPENIKSLGLYRTSGNLATIQKIRFEIDKGQLEILDEYAKDPDVLTGSLKLFFRELKEPLISCDVCDRLLKVMNGEKQYTKKDRDKIQSIINNLPKCNADTLRLLIKHLIQVVWYKDHNKMDTYNISVCWGPTIIFATESFETITSKDLVTQSADATRVFDALLTFYINYPEDLDTEKNTKPEYCNIIHREGSRDSIHSFDSNHSKGQKAGSSDPYLNIDECLKKFVELIEVNLTKDGVYVRPGSMERTGKIMKKLTKKKIHEIDKYKDDVHQLTDCLKRYLREYPESLTTKETVEQVNNICDNNHCLEQHTRQKVKSIIRESVNKDTLLFLIKHLIRVIKHENYHNVPRHDMVSIWTDVLNYQDRILDSSETFSKFLNILLDVFDDSKHDETVQKGMSNGLLNDLRNLQSQKEKDRVSKYDNVPEEPDIHREATILEEKTEIEYTRL